MDAVEDVLEEIGRFATGTVNGIKITVSLQRMADMRGGFFIGLRPSEHYWKLAVNTPDFHRPIVFTDNSRRFGDKAAATAEFEALVAKYGLDEERKPRGQ